MKRRLSLTCAATILATVLLCSVYGSALALATSSLQISVIDASTKAPLALVNVSIIGPAVRIGFTDEHGVVRFDNVPPGTYFIRLAKLKYKPSTLPNLTTAGGEDSRVTMSMSQVLKTIGAVTVKTTSALSDSHITSNSPEATASGSLASALGINAFVDIAAGFANAENASIDGHPPNTTALFVDGAPAAPLGTATNLRALATDIFDAASISTDITGSSGGALDFHIPDPTLALSYSFDGSYGSYDRSRDAFFARGTAGRMGYSLADGSAGYSDVLNGKRYFDTSGLDYVHDASSIARTVALKLRYPITQNNVVSGNILASNSDAADYCRQFAARTPCGYGPGNYSTDTLRTLQIRDAAMLGSTSLNVQFFSTHGTVHDNQEQRFLNGSPSPLTASFSAQTTGFSMAMSSPLGRRNVLNANILSERTGYSGNAIVGTLPTGTSSHSFAFNAASVGTTLHFLPRTTVSLQSGVSAVTGSSAAPNANVSLVWNPTNADRIAALYSAGNLQMPSIASTGISDPQSLEFNCTARAAYGYGPGSAVPTGDSSTARVSWLHHFADAQVLVSLHQQTVHNDIINAYANGAAFSNDIFPPGYFEAASSLYASTLQCGQQTALRPTDVYYVTPFAARTKYGGVSIRAKLPLGGTLIAVPYYVTTVAKAVSVMSHAISGLGLVAGSQLPNVPLHRYGVTFDWKAPRSRLETVLNFAHVSTNNRNNLPAYALVNAGALLPLVRGDLILSLTNVFNQLTGLYVSPKNAVPIMTNGGAAIPVLASPLDPRSFHIEYRVRIGQPESRPPPSDLESELGAPTSATFSLQPFPAERPSHAFDIMTNNPACGPESIGIARQLLGALKAYVSANDFVDSKNLPYGVTVRHHLTPSGYVLLIGGGARGALTSLFACGNIHGGSDNDVGKHGLYIPTVDESRHYDLLFDPRVGLYVTDLFASKPVQLSLRRLSQVPQPAPFTMITGTACSSELKGAAALTLDSLKRYFSNVALGQNPPAPQGMTIIDHHDPNEWFEIRFSDPQLSSAVLQCGMVASGTLGELKKFGLSGVRIPDLGYATRLGLYVRSD